MLEEYILFLEKVHDFLIAIFESYEVRRIDIAKYAGLALGKAV